MLRLEVRLIAAIAWHKMHTCTIANMHSYAAQPLTRDDAMEWGFRLRDWSLYTATCACLYLTLHIILSIHFILNSKCSELIQGCTYTQRSRALSQCVCVCARCARSLRQLAMRMSERNGVAILALSQFRPR